MLAIRRGPAFAGLCFFGSRRDLLAYLPSVMFGPSVRGALVGSGEAPSEGLASARRSNCSCRFPASSFHDDAFR